MMAHTSNLSVMGPESVDGEPDYAIMADGRIVGEAYGRSDSEHLEPSLGNALLWAAAPDLLAACKSEIGGIRSSWHHFDTNDGARARASASTLNKKPAASFTRLGQARITLVTTAASSAATTT